MLAAQNMLLGFPRDVRHLDVKCQGERPRFFKLDLNSDGEHVGKCLCLLSHYILQLVTTPYPDAYVGRLLVWD